VGFGYLVIIENLVRGLRPQWTPWLLTDNAGLFIIDSPIDFPLLARSTLEAGLYLAAVAAVLLLTGCSDFWRRGDDNGEPNYFNCGSGASGVHQPGFSRNAVRWLIETDVLGTTGALGTDTFGPDPSSDAAFMPTWLTLRKHRLTIENLTNLDALPALGAWVVLGSPRNVNGSGAPGTVFGFVP